MQHGFRAGDSAPKGIVMRLIANLIAIAAAGALATPAQNLRVGTFHQPSIVVAYYRSPQWAAVLNSKLAEREQAKKANDAKKVEELETWGKAHQEMSHRQLAGEAPITNILEALQPAFPEIAKSVHVAAIAADLPYVDGTVEKVDITDALLDWLKADDRTRSIVRDIRGRKAPLSPLHE